MTSGAAYRTGGEQPADGIVDVRERVVQGPWLVRRRPPGDELHEFLPRRLTRKWRFLRRVEREAMARQVLWGPVHVELVGHAAPGRRCRSTLQQSVESLYRYVRENDFQLQKLTLVMRYGQGVVVRIRLETARSSRSEVSVRGPEWTAAERDKFLNVLLFEAAEEAETMRLPRRKALIAFAMGVATSFVGSILYAALR